MKIKIVSLLFVAGIIQASNSSDVGKCPPGYTPIGEGKCRIYFMDIQCPPGYFPIGNEKCKSVKQLIQKSGPICPPGAVLQEDGTCKNGIPKCPPDYFLNEDGICETITRITYNENKYICQTGRHMRKDGTCHRDYTLSNAIRYFSDWFGISEKLETYGIIRTFSCPEGYSLASNGRCQLGLTVNKRIKCPPGYYQPGNGRCKSLPRIVYQNGPNSPNCPPGYHINKDGICQTVIRATYKTGPICPPKSHLENGKCRRKIGSAGEEAKTEAESNLGENHPVDQPVVEASITPNDEYEANEERTGMISEEK